MQSYFIKIQWLILGLLLCFQAAAQNQNRSFTGYKQNLGTIEIQVSDGNYVITPFTKKIFHVAFYPQQEKVKNYSYALAATPEKVHFIIKDKENTLMIESSGIKVKVTKEPFNLSFYHFSDLLISENNGYQWSDSSQQVSFGLTPDEILYGGGARVMGMNRRGNRLQLYNRAHYGYETHSELMNYTLPVVLSSGKYALLFDNASAGYLDLDSKNNNTLTYETESGTLNYYVIAANNWYELVDNYTWLTGRQPMPARWTLGNFSSRFGYHSQNEVLSTVDKFFEASIPVEAVIIDIYWFGKEIMGTMGNLNWYRDSFPDPDQMIATLNKKGVKPILVTEPFILTTSDRWGEAVNNDILAKDSLGNPFTYDFYFGNTGLIDVFKPEAREWFWNIYKDFTAQGIGGWWGDLGEPEVHPKDLLHVNGSANEVHNAYGHEWAKIIFDGYRSNFPEVRPFILMRAGFAGSQRYGMIPWTGDVNRSWGGLGPQPEISLQMGMQGIAYMHSDLGGFAGGEEIDDELYTRWLQYGVFQPIYRPHAQEHIPAEPVFQKPATKALAKEAIALRYKLLPYIYSMAFENSQSGKPLMIPLFFNEDKNHDLLTYDQAYMFGDAFLVSPVKIKGAKNQKVYLPKGSQWVDFNTALAYEGGQEIEVTLAEKYIPVFVKGGSFVPMHAQAKQTQYYSLDAFEVHYYFDAQQTSSQYRLYNDDGSTFDAFGKGLYEFIYMQASTTDKELVLNFSRENGRNFTGIRQSEISLVIHNLDRKPKKISVNGAKIKGSEFTYDENQRSVVLKMALRNTEKEVRISY
ncbi:MAG: glycosyl hydrolase [Bacteroidetes bacterium HGW-Bacteroidetes-4]|jgi:alpha-glucosidase (family GH31 glycosyl hydrolase)|nr:MAG: glycosyl hydrolase [Bacteroidetes bacterium HGW-Bacteroidetes-4]